MVQYYHEQVRLPSRQADHTLFTKDVKDGKKSIFIVYVDDMIITGDDTQEVKDLKKQLKAGFEVKGWGTLSYLLGMELAKNNQSIFISQRKSTLDLLKETRKLGYKPARTLLELNWKRKDGDKDTPMDKRRSQKLVGKWIDLSLTRPDIAFAVSVVSPFLQQPAHQH